MGTSAAFPSLFHSLVFASDSCVVLCVCFCFFFHLYIVMCCLMIGMCSEKCVVRRLCRCVNITEYIHMNLGGVACHTPIILSHHCRV